jgi:hypothetical protein
MDGGGCLFRRPPKRACRAAPYEPTTKRAAARQLDGEDVVRLAELPDRSKSGEVLHEVHVVEVNGTADFGDPAGIADALARRCSCRTWSGDAWGQPVPEHFGGDARRFYPQLLPETLAGADVVFKRGLRAAVAQPALDDVDGGFPGRPGRSRRIRGDRKAACKAGVPKSSKPRSTDEAQPGPRSPRRRTSCMRG